MDVKTDLESDLAAINAKLKEEDRIALEFLENREVAIIHCKTEKRIDVMRDKLTFDFIYNWEMIHKEII